MGAQSSLPPPLTTVFKLLLGEQPPRSSVHKLDWKALVPVARENAVLLRLDARVAALGERLPAPVREAVAAERRRVGAAQQLMSAVAANCERHGIPYLFPKALQHYPDMGRDLDLVALTGGPAADPLILGGLTSRPGKRTLRERIARATTHTIDAHGIKLDIRHGRLGMVGEDRRFPLALVRNSRKVVVDGHEHRAPAPEDALLLLATQKVWGRRAFRIADVLAAAMLVRQGRLDWAVLAGRARHVHGLASLSCFLTYVDQIYGDTVGRPLVPDDVRQALIGRGWGDVAFRDGRLRFPVWRVHLRTFGARVVGAVRSGDFGGAARLGLLPGLFVTRRLASLGQLIG